MARQIVKAQEQALMDSMLADSGAGMETADKESFAIPFLTVLQKISPQVDEADAEYVEGAKGGMLINTVTKALYDGKEGIIFLPCAYQRRFLRWGSRGTSGGGFKGEVLPEEVARLREEGDVVERDGRLYFPLEDGQVDEKRCDHLTDTRNHFGIIVDGDNTSQALLSLTSTQIKKSKQLMSLLNAVKVPGPRGLVTPPTWVNQMRLTTVLESNDKGSWYGLKFTPEGFVADPELYAMAKAFHDIIVAGEAKVAYEPAPGDTRF